MCVFWGGFIIILGTSKPYKTYLIDPFVAPNDQLYILYYYLDPRQRCDIKNSMLRTRAQKEPKVMFDFSVQLLEKRNAFCTQQNVQKSAHSLHSGLHLF